MNDWVSAHCMNKYHHVFSKYIFVMKSNGNSKYSASCFNVYSNIGQQVYKCKSQYWHFIQNCSQLALHMSTKFYVWNANHCTQTAYIVHICIYRYISYLCYISQSTVKRYCMMALSKSLTHIESTTILSRCLYHVRISLAFRHAYCNGPCHISYLSGSCNVEPL